MSDSLALATAVADLAGVVKGYAGRTTSEPATLDDVREPRDRARRSGRSPARAELVELASRLEYLQ